jgi:threonine dehydratase
MSSGICPAVAVRNGLGLKTRLIGLVSAQAPTYAESYERGSVVEAPVSTRVGDGIATRKAEQEPLAILPGNIDHIVRVNDDEVEASMRHFFTDAYTAVEGAGAAGLAAALKEKDQLCGKRMAVRATGGNVDRDVFARILQGLTASPVSM